MKKGKSKRPAFTKAALKRALNPPHDDTQAILHGKLVKDPFRPLENLDAPETKAWVARHNQRFEDYCNFQNYLSNFQNYLSLRRWRF